MINTFLVKASTALIRAYQVCLSPFLPQSCRFHPCCSEYALTAIKRHGFLKGLYLGVMRLSRCHPYHPGGYDPVK